MTVDLYGPIFRIDGSTHQINFSFIIFLGDLWNPKTYFLIFFNIKDVLFKYGKLYMYMIGIYYFHYDFRGGNVLSDTNIYRSDVSGNGGINGRFRGKDSFFRIFGRDIQHP